MTGDNSVDKQQTELEVLKSIFDKDLRCEGKSCIITLWPLHDSLQPEAHTQIDLHVICSDNYPDEVPTVILDNSKGLSKLQVKALEGELEALALNLKGEVMIFELTRCVREFLHENNKPGIKSFYEEMVSRNRQMEEAKHQSEEDKIIKQMQDIQEKISKKEKDVPGSSDEDEETDKEEEWADRHVQFSSTDEAQHRQSVSSYAESEPSCDHHCCRYIQFNNKVLRGRCVEHEEFCTCYCALDNNTGEQLILREWVVRYKQKAHLTLTRALDSIQQEFNYLKKLHHENLISYLDLKSNQEKDEITVYLLQQFASSMNMSMYLSADFSVDVSFVRHVVVGVLRALYYLHQHNVFHRNLKPSSVYLDRAGVVRLGDYSLVKRMDDVCHTSLGKAPVVREKTDRKSDVMQLGQILTSLFADMVGAVPELRDLISKCVGEDSWGARRLLDHHFVKAPVSREVNPRRSKVNSRQTVESSGEEGEQEDVMYSNLLIPKDLKAQSRLSSEFKVLRYLGSGSFGKVLKAKNKLDGCVYAIKVIELNPRNRQLNRKMMREVKLLSKLNHENVVRYYNSWIETTNVDDSVVTNVTSTPLQTLQTLTDARSYKMGDGLDSRGSDIKGGVSCGGTGDRDMDEEDEDDSDSSDEDEDEDSSSFSKSGRAVGSDRSSSIVFSEEVSKIRPITASSIAEDSCEAEPLSEIRSMYIQMEFCEKSTLRIAIDENLCEDEPRFWKLFREIVEGLAYIHEQDMIHRDLKPVNIFLDSEDHVKIGDFGLATRSVISRHPFVITSLSMTAADRETSSHLLYDDSHTGGVGTSYYVAPELQKHLGKTHYDKKVDIYSLGIMFFEMCHPRFTTEMERFETLVALRKPEVTIPRDVDGKCMRQMELVRLLLNHDPKQRPTCDEILQGDYLPPPQVEDAELKEFVRYTLSNPQSKAYKYLISSCFDQRLSMEDDLTYHLHSVVSERQHGLLEMVKGAAERVLQRHGARLLSTPLLLPRSELHEGAEGVVRCMTHSGGIVGLPYDLRVSFARYVARRDVMNLRRYAVDRIYKERKVHGYHPRELYECAFDVVTPSAGDLMVEAELLTVLGELVSEFPSLKTRGCVLRINHALLIHSILVNFGLEKLGPDLCRTLVEAKDNKHSRNSLESSLLLLQISDQLAGTLASLFQKEDVLSKVSLELFGLVKRKPEAVSLAKKGVHTLKMIIANAEALGLKVPVRVNLGVVSHVDASSGVMFDMVCQVKQKRRREGREGVDVIATGCRYDGLVARFRKMFEMMGTTAPRTQHAAGVSIYLDKIVSAVKEDRGSEGGWQEWMQGVDVLDVVVCSLGHDTMVKDKAQLLKGLWAAGARSCLLENIADMEDLLSYCREMRVKHIVTLKDTERGVARVRSADKYQEKKISLGEVVDLVTRGHRMNTEVLEPLALRQDLKTSSSETCAASPTVNIHILAEDKMLANMRRRYENHVTAKLSLALANFSSRPSIEVIGVFLDINIVKALAANFETSDDCRDNTSNVLSLIDKNPKKKYLTKICDKIHGLYTDKTNVVVIVYSLHSDKYRLMMSS